MADYFPTRGDTHGRSVIEAYVPSPDDAELQICAFATACVACGLGLFEIVPRSYLVRFETRASVRVSTGFDDDGESWFGEAVVHCGDTR